MDHCLWSMDFSKLYIHPARNLDALGVYPASFFGTQEGYHAAYIIRHTRTAKSRSTGNHFIYFGVVAGAAAAKVGLYGARCNHIYGDTTRAQFFGHITAQRFNSALHTGISAIPRVAETRK